MKLNRNPTARNHERVPDSAAKPTQRTGGTEALPGAGGPEHFRRLKWNEVVFRGDFVENETSGF